MVSPRKKIAPQKRRLAVNYESDDVISIVSSAIESDQATLGASSSPSEPHEASPSQHITFTDSKPTQQMASSKSPEGIVLGLTKVCNQKEPPRKSKSDTTPNKRKSMAKAESNVEYTTKGVKRAQLDTHGEIMEAIVTEAAVSKANSDTKTAEPEKSRAEASKKLKASAEAGLDYVPAANAAKKNAEERLKAAAESEKEPMAKVATGERAKTLPAKTSQTAAGAATAESAVPKAAQKRVEEPHSKTADSAGAKKKKKLNLQDRVYNHMLVSFKPYLIKSLAQELQSTESELNYIMLSLTDKNLVVQKEFTSSKGRTKTLYWANHGVKAKEVHVTLASAEEIAVAKKELQDLQRQESSILSLLAAVNEGPSNEALAAQLNREESELGVLKNRLAEMKQRIRDSRPQDTTNTQSKNRGPEEKSAADLARERCPRRLKQRINFMREEWKKRKTTTMDFVESMADGMEKKPKDILKLLEIETDEMVSVKMPPKYDI